MSMDVCARYKLSYSIPRAAHEPSWQALSVLKRTASRFLSPSAKVSGQSSFALKHDPSLDGTEREKVLGSQCSSDLACQEKREWAGS
jgi:hypothetical protein